MPSPARLPLALLVLALADPCAGAGAQERELPPGPARRALERLSGSEAPALPGPGTWPDWEDPAWDGPEPWRRWEELLGRPPGDGVRAELAGAALAQRRFDDAWGHLAAVADPALVAALLPRFVPGAPPSAAAAPGGRPGALAAGTLLCPALPPPPDGGRDGRAREMRSAPFTVGATRLDLRVLLEPESGVQLDLRHLEGPPVELGVRLPVPYDVALEAVYVDWDRREESTPRVPVTLSAEAGEVSLWGAFVPHRAGFTARLPAALPAGFARAGVRVRPGAGARTACFAAVLARRLAVPLLDADAPRPELHPLELGPLPPGGLRALVSAAERFLASGDAARGAGEKEAGSDAPR